MNESGLPQGTAIGRYELIRLIGAGGMGEVYAAYDRDLERKVALKILPSGLTADPRRVDRFMTEAKTASALNHPAIVAVYQIGQTRLAETAETIHFIAMELIDGSTLGHWLDRSEPSASIILDVLSTICRAIGRVHSRGIIHRDLKPDNIMIDATGHPKLLDFGIAKLSEPELPENGIATGRPTEPSTMLGTIGYMSPEQVEGKPVDHRSDIFSLGCILYEALTSRQPFVGETRAESLHRIVHRPPDPLDLEDEQLSDSLQRILDRCLSKDRENRYDSALDLAWDLDRLAAERTTKTRGVSDRILPAAGFRRAASIVVASVLILSMPAGALVDSLGHSSRKELEEQLNEQRETAAELALSLQKSEQERMQMGIEIERLRSERARDEEFKNDLEASYRNFVVDMTKQIRGDESEKKRLETRLDTAEAELERFRVAQTNQKRRDTLRDVANQLNVVIPVEVSDVQVAATLPGSIFGTGGATPSIEAKPVLARISAALKATPELKARIEGHADSNGAADENQRLSLDRADMIRDILVSNGVDGSRITTIGHGELRPIVSNDTFYGRIRNRRVEIVLSY